CQAAGGPGAGAVPALGAQAAAEPPQTQRAAATQAVSTFRVFPARQASRRKLLSSAPGVQRRAARAQTEFGHAGAGNSVSRLARSLPPAKQSFADRRAQTEFGHEIAALPTQRSVECPWFSSPHDIRSRTMKRTVFVAAVVALLAGLTARLPAGGKQDGWVK